MGIILSFNCNNCFNHETHYVGIGVIERNERLLYVCANCEALTSTNAKTPRCRKCRSRRLTEVHDDVRIIKCPECKHEGVLEMGGRWY